MSNVTTLNPRTHAVRKALERYAELHPSQSNHKEVQEDLGGFIIDILTDLVALCDENDLDAFECWRKALYQYSEEP